MISFLDSDFSHLNTYLDQNTFSQLFILVDENTHQHCLPILLSNLATDIPFEIIEIEAGEEMKNINTAIMIWEILSEFKADRKALLLNLGGGVITDLGGFVASTYKRGISFIHLPTSLLGMCDASIGGKTGIDLGSLKNMVGSFTFPEQIFVYPNFLRTLPQKELQSGFAEMLKHGLINDKVHFQSLTELEYLNAEEIMPLISPSMSIKHKIVEKDFKEQNIRKILNFGHTFGHAIESLFLDKGQPITHGEAVAIGMIMETHLSYLENLISEEESDQIIRTIKKYFPLYSIDEFSDEQIFEKMQNDKKNQRHNINFTLLKSAGEAVFDMYPSKKNIFKSICFYQIDCK
ncbi:MAG: 3-dehydroquinate synthase [Flavobacteriales bacterium]|nr:MAG: 3-dehydroquinate synthase [Flavobacteriales bacterium]